MSEQWIKMRSNLGGDLRVIKLATLTGLDEFAVVGRLHTVWSWLDCHSEDGTNVTVSRGYIDRITCHAGFAKAMEAVEWLSGEDGDLIFPDYTHHNGATAKRRATDAKRQRTNRNGSAPRHARTVTHVTASGGAEGEGDTAVTNVTAPAVAGGEVKPPKKVRIPKKKEPKATNPEHQPFISGWCEYYSKRHNGTKYPFNGRDAAAVETILAHFGNDATAAKIFIGKVHKRSAEGFPFAGAETLYDIANGLARLEAGLAQPIKGAPAAAKTHDPQDQTL